MNASKYTSISPQSQTSAPAVATNVMPAGEQLQSVTDIKSLQKISIQCKLSIGAPDDPLEHEADTMTDTIMRMPEQNFIQRKCSQCEEEEKLQRKPLASFIQRKESSAGATASDAITNQINSSKGSGSNMDSQTQSFMQSRFGADFSDIKIHTGTESTQLNRELNAKAFTVGNDIYFNGGQYNPNSDTGKHLLAHELTHTVQQLGVKSVIQQAHDFDIRRIEPNSADFPNMIFFDQGSATIVPGELTKITTLTSTAGFNSIPLTLKGMASEEGDPAANAIFTQSRITAVDNALRTAGHTAVRTPNNSATSGLGRIEYRQMRAIEIIQAGASSGVPPARAVVPCTNFATYPGHFTTAITEAQRLVSLGIAALGAAPLTANTKTLLRRFFGSDSAAKALEVKGKLDGGSGLHTHIGNMIGAAAHECVNVCPSAAGWNTGIGAGAIMTLCPSFFSNGLVSRADLLIHEGAHGTTNIHGDDHSYSHQRLIEFLDPGQSIENPDSFVLFLQMLDGQTPAIGRPISDTSSGFASADEETQVKKSLAWLESYLTQTYLQFDSLYNELDSHRAAGTNWSPGFYSNMMGLVAAQFPVTTPPTVITTNRDDQIKIASIHDRYQIMREIFRESSGGVFHGLNVTRVVGGSSWAAGPSLNVNVGDDFFALRPSPIDQVKFLMGKLVAATPDIGAALEPKYVTLLDNVRILLPLPSPPPP
jgi:Domain of unknown function (DUF4157)/Lysine-specific metallo-endopeptidase